MALHERNWYRIFSCMLAMLVGIGLVRYSYSPLIPSMLDVHWITAAEAGYIGTSNFLGNMVGAIFCSMLAFRFTAGWICRWSMILGLLSVFGSSFDFGFAWFAGCRFLAGLTAGGVMILAPVIALSGIKTSARSTVIGMVFVGCGIGVIGLSLLLPIFVCHEPPHPARGWWFTSALVLVCIILSWRGLSPKVVTDKAQREDESDTPIAMKRMWIFMIAYTLGGAGIVPHSIYISAYIHKILDMPLSFSTMVYAIYGAGVLVGGPIFGAMSKLIGTYLALIATTTTCLAAVIIVLSTDSVWFVAGSSALLGAGQMGIAVCTTHRALQLVGPTNHTRWWGRLTIMFNIGQAGGAFAMGAMIHLHYGYLAGFWMGAGCLLLSAVLYSFVRKPHTRAMETGDTVHHD